MRQHIEIVEGAGGPKARIVGHRIRVQDIAIWHEKLGMSPDEIVFHYPDLTLADVYAALAYYWDHRDDIEATIARDDAFVEELRRTTPSILEEKLRQRHQGISG
ncbi:MAG TPA: DUF433 domain-containing protein [Thermomicrobiales bacterium]|nr:DUF433 domain-containing protein [Thermomicrobiales bacterium]